MRAAAMRPFSLPPPRAQARCGLRRLRRAARGIAAVTVDSAVERINQCCALLLALATVLLVRRIG
ncbi:hypothetical protein DEO45_01650 [Rhodanobacter denitrificans]|uniref:Uncharacterized protein n=1 Tax=Rhodanobacter denitrificans TaxID=666685 RepID=A0A368KJV3_9GAMM|nr:hypothetical protein DEO45_01650 [Rhodanobacter denitrificans]